MLLAVKGFIYRNWFLMHHELLTILSVCLMAQCEPHSSLVNIHDKSPWKTSWTFDSLLQLCALWRSLSSRPVWSCSPYNSHQLRYFHSCRSLFEKYRDTGLCREENDVISACAHILRHPVATWPYVDVRRISNFSRANPIWLSVQRIQLASRLFDLFLPLSETSGSA